MTKTIWEVSTATSNGLIGYPLPGTDYKVHYDQDNSSAYTDIIPWYYPSFDSRYNPEQLSHTRDYKEYRNVYRHLCKKHWDNCEM